MPNERSERVMWAGSSTPRTPLVISAGDLVVGPIHAPFRSSDPSSLLHNYLVLIRQLRGQHREKRLTLRGEDISALAAHLGESEATVLFDLLDLMGATRAQKKVLFSLFAAGALTIVATGSVALNLSSTGSAADLPATVDVVVPIPDPVIATSTDAAPFERAAAHAVVDEPAAVAPDRGSPIAERVGGPAQLVGAPTLPEGVGIADDGSTVAVAPAPVPSVAGEGVADDGSIVAVAPAPVPAVEGEGVADDGSVVAVAPPPLP